MAGQPKSFLPISDDEDAQLERLARDKGVGRLEKPAQPGSGEGEGANSLPISDISAEASYPETGATPRSQMKKVNVELPDYVWTELKIRAARQQTSVRHVIMDALRADGFTIRDADMIEDGRRLRGSNRPSQTSDAMLG